MNFIHVKLILTQIIIYKKQKIIVIYCYFVHVNKIYFIKIILVFSKSIKYFKKVLIFF